MTTPSDDSQTLLRRNIYLLLILLAAGSMLGRVLAVDRVDKQALETQRVKQVQQKLDRLRGDLRRRGLRPAEVEARIAKLVQQDRLWDWARLRQPFFSANDRSRWCSIRVLVERDLQVPGYPYAIDRVQDLAGWDTIDMVKHDGHLFSSKPPLLPTLMAGLYWVIYHGTGLSLGTHPYAVVRIMLVLVNVIPLSLSFWLLARLLERLGTTDWGRLVVVGAATFGTFLTTFAVTVNNHLPAAVAATVALYAGVRIWFDGQCSWRYFVIAGLAAAFAAACELPALSLLVLLGLVLLWKAPWQTLWAYVPAAGVVVVAFVFTNWIAHRSLLPAYLHRSEITRLDVQAAQPAVAQAVEAALGTVLETAAADGGSSPPSATPHYTPATMDAFKAAMKEPARDWVCRYRRKDLQKLVTDILGRLKRAELQPAAHDALDEADLEATHGDNWYDYAYRRGGRVYDSYWRQPQGIDRGERSPMVYAFHVLIGHHGIFSLTPFWLLTVGGIVLWLGQPRERNFRELALWIAGLSLVCLAFYLSRGPVYRNYGGVTSGLRWMFWLAPLWLVAAVPAADAVAARRCTRGLALLLLLFSVLSASYPVWNPWTHPWIFEYLHRYLGFG